MNLVCIRGAVVVETLIFYKYLSNRLIINISYIIWKMACMIVINIIFEVRRPSETLVGILDLNIGISVIFIFSKFINYLYIYAYILLD